MASSFVMNIYRRKYEGQITFDQFQAYLNKGLNLLRRSKPTADPQDAKAIEIALEYNMESVMRQLNSSQDFYD